MTDLIEQLEKIDCKPGCTEQHVGDCDDCPLAVALAAAAELERLQLIIDSRPAINAGLPDSYIKWSQSIYEADFVNVTQTTN